MKQQPTIQELKDNSELPVIVADSEGIAVYVNHHFETVFGWTYQEIVGQSIAEILPVEFRDAHILGFARFTATEVSTILNHPLQLKALTKDNRAIDCEHFIIAEKERDRWLFAAILRPLE